MEFRLPEVSEGVESADVAELLVAEGDVIEAGQVVLEVETEKAVAEIECPHAGQIARVHVVEGDTVTVGDVLLTIEMAPEGERPKASKPAASRSAAAVSAMSQTQGREETTPDAQPARPPSEPESQLPAARKAVREDRDVTPPAPAGPATRRLARHLGVDLHQVTGTSSGGRITEDDVKAYVRDRMAGIAASASGGSGPIVAPPLPDFSQFGRVECQPLNKVAKTSGANLSLSWQLIPHVTQHDLADITELEAARRRYVQSADDSVPKITMTAIVVKAVVGVLKALPHVNASLDPATNELILKHYYHIGCAVDTPRGLLVPVVRDVDKKSVADVAAEIAGLAARARERKLQLKEMQGASFTISNLGGIAGTAFTPIVNYPEVAVLGLSRTRKELRLTEEGQLEERLMLPLSLSYDHRVVNGADGARFVAKLSRDLSDFFHLLVEC